mmetsp:Transcript_10613/g.31392  ORF Transcript_10613/g.31392 Transcript_10613/m.31392 type:complete len:221 (-) Transcript_10613:533-1195(-)
MDALHPRRPAEDDRGCRLPRDGRKALHIRGEQASENEGHLLARHGPVAGGDERQRRLSGQAAGVDERPHQSAAEHAARHHPDQVLRPADVAGGGGRRGQAGGQGPGGSANGGAARCAAAQGEGAPLQAQAGLRRRAVPGRPEVQRHRHGPDVQGHGRPRVRHLLREAGGQAGRRAGPQLQDFALRRGSREAAGRRGQVRRVRHAVRPDKEVPDDFQGLPE